MSNFKLIQGSAVNQNVDAIVNAANKYLIPGAGICGNIYKKAGYFDLDNYCKRFDKPLNDGDNVITPSFNISNCKFIIHSVGPDFSATPDAFDKLYDAYYKSLITLKENNLHSISFPLISSGIFGGNLDNPVKISTEYCVKAYNDFIKNFSDYEIEVLLCAFSENEYTEANTIIKQL